ncbi:hypothetical protein [Hymenobacter lapidiphilus]|uniref:Lipoprotein n=1 Tax=Hymenobacter lapidiphilus TaxID=2608003 RepID=A0A7Y7U8B6_9BACT|nr:hypothetical protein [Hymenobacter lapidiphilus]NVO33390.1 hypothetical protein [Hymenobacter lapidiphilus]
MNKNNSGPLLLATTLLALLSGCDTRSTTTATSPTDLSETTPTAQPRQLCYRQVVGGDTTLVNLRISGATVTGELAVLPAEKDRARGPLTGTLTGEQIVADWQRMGEGQTQVHEVRFTLAGDSLRWREGARTEENGKWVLTNPEQGYQYVLGKVACAPQP